MLSTFTPTLYVQLSPDRLTLRNPKTGAALSEPPEVAIEPGPKAKLVAVGATARAAGAGSAAVQVLNPFAHPRSLVSDFTVGEQVLKAFVRRLLGRGLWTPAPRIVLHPQGDPAGGYTQVEIRALHEMALGAGASQVVVWQGRGLTDAELLSRSFPTEGRVLS